MAEAEKKILIPKTCASCMFYGTFQAAVFGYSGHCMKDTPKNHVLEFDLPNGGVTKQLFTRPLTSAGATCICHTTE